MKNFKPQTKAPKGALCACGDNLGPHFLAADGGSVPESRAPWAPAPRFSSAGEPSWGDVWEVIKSQGPAAIQAWLRKQAEYMAGRAAPYYGGQRQVNGAANLKEQLDMLAGTARGATAATLGAPGDLQSLGRAAMAAPRGPLSALEALQQPTMFPKSEELKKGERGFLARGAGTPGENVGEAFGDFVPIIPPSTVRAGARAAGRGAEAVGRRVERGVERGLEDPGIIGDITRAAGRTFATSPARAVKPKGGNFAENRLANYLDQLGVYTPEMDEFGIPGGAEAGAAPSGPVADWMRKQLRNYLRKDLGSPTDPLLAVEREIPGLHLPAEDLLGPYAEDAHRVNALLGDPKRQETTTLRALAEKHRALTKDPMTAWGMLSGRQLHRIDPMDYAADIAQWVPEGSTAEGPMAILRDAFGEEGMIPKSLHWLEKAPPDTHIWSLTDPYTDELGFGHVRDYLEAATGAHGRVRRYGTPDDLRTELQLHGGPGRRELDLHDAGLTLDPESLGRLSVADAVRKTAQWNKFMADQGAADGPLSKGWKEFKAYPDKGMRWVEFGAPEAAADAPIPDGYELRAISGYSTTPGEGNYGYRWVAPDSPEATRWTLAPIGAKMPSEFPAGFADTPEMAKKRGLEELRSRDLREGLGAEGDAMGHCVGGYCDDVLTRGTKIYSLRDAKGRPHVTIEVRPGMLTSAQLDPIRDAVWPLFGKGKYMSPGDNIAAQYSDAARADPNVAALTPLEWAARKHGISFPDKGTDIIQIKGKGNAAPIEEYLPFVQDFVRSGKWGRVGDLGNTGLVHFSGGRTNIRDVHIGPASVPNPNRRVFENVEMPKGYMTPAEAAEFLVKQGVPSDLANTHVGNFSGAADRFGRARGQYAHGGRVEERDPEGFLPRTLDETVDYALRVFGKQ